ncbi:MAG TPA: MFS transporter [Streptosporangiaceae bacterium]|nr:MFS transporter [Streptosporangiaceae bacterium]
MTAILKARAAPVAPARRPRLVTRPLLVRFVSVIGAEASFYLPLSVVPLYVKSSGSDAGAGFATSTLLLATVAAELATPRLVSRAGYRLSLTAGLLLLGAPACALLWPANLAMVIAVSVLRGAGFAITTVAGGALTASLIPEQRRGEGLGLVGVVGGVPALVSLPAGVLVAARWGYGPVFAATAAAALLALGSVPWLPATRHAGQRGGEVLPVLRNRGVARLAAIFAASAAAAGVLVTFLPLAVTAGSAAVVTSALFAQPAAATAARWAAGRIGDRHGQARLLCPAVLLCAAGMASLAATHVPVLVVGGATCFGAGFGVLQNATLAMMYTIGPRGAYSAVSAIWNAAYDAGMGAGAAGVGLLVAHTGYPAAFLLTAALVVPALGLPRGARGCPRVVRPPRGRRRPPGAASRNGGLEPPPVRGKERRLRRCAAGGRRRHGRPARRRRGSGPPPGTARAAA